LLHQLLPKLLLKPLLKRHLLLRPFLRKHLLLRPFLRRHLLLRPFLRRHLLLRPFLRKHLLPRLPQRKPVTIPKKRRRTNPLLTNDIETGGCKASRFVFRLFTAR
jgi:hypothetical protein